VTNQSREILTKIPVNRLFANAKRYKPAVPVRNIGRGEIVSYVLRLRSLFLIVGLCSLLSVPLFAQMETATLSGAITDPNGSVVPDVEVAATRIETGTEVTTKTNGAGIYFFTGLMPGHYHLMIRKAGFKEIAIKEFELHVQDKLEQNFSLEIGSVSETVTVTANDLNINTTDATVSTVIDRQFAENLPMNGRSFQTLIELTPGVVVTPSTFYDNGQFSINGQRAASNYWMVDGVSANVGIGGAANSGNGLGGALPAFSAQGGTNSLVSVDALQEFRIQTSTYAPEFGRTPGGQISIVTRSGTNQFHGGLFDYFRNDALDANDWFAKRLGLPKPEERQNDFGGTFSGPLWKDRTFFFFSYEGLRLRLPQVEETEVPDLTARKSAIAAIQPYLNAFPLPTAGAPDNTTTGVAEFNSSFSNRSTLDAYSLRIDHKLTNSLTLFGRYNYSPSQILQRGLSNSSLSTVSPVSITTQTATVGLTWSLSAQASNDFRFNYSRANASSSYYLDSFGGALPLTSVPLPSPFTEADSTFYFVFPTLADAGLAVGESAHNLQRQFNIVDSFVLQRGPHTLKFGVDYRRLSPLTSPPLYSQLAYFPDVPSAESGDLEFSYLTSALSPTLLFRNLGVYAQDTWRVFSRLTVTYGLRWDVDFAPSSLSGQNLLGVTGFNLNNLSQLALAPAGTPPYHTPYGNVAPRLGIAYQLSQNSDWATVLRGGFGVFFDLATQEVGTSIYNSGYPFSAYAFNPGGTFPLDAATAAPPPISLANLTSGTFVAFDPHLQLPYTLEWNVALQQGLGKNRSVSATYVGAAGKRLLQSGYLYSIPNPTFGPVEFVTNAGVSSYQAFQLQFDQSVSHGLQALASYTLSHCIDDGSASSLGNESNAVNPTLSASSNRGPCDFDVRNAFSTGLTYDVPAPHVNTLANAVLHHWSVQSIIQARSAPPVNIYDSGFYQLFNGATEVRPDLIPGIPLYLYGPQYPGGKIINDTPNQGGPGCLGPFCPPPTNSMGVPVRQGDLSRNALRGFGATQWDFAIHRDFPIHESVKLEFRAEMFNLLNHPNFGPPVSDINNSQFGHSTAMLGQSLNGGNIGLGSNVGAGGFSPLYQLGGPRSVQLALKLQF
jgi:Carboxypeptidase regulatory-like domain/TonB dependent receptor